MGKFAALSSKCSDDTIEDDLLPGRVRHGTRPFRIKAGSQGSEDLQESSGITEMQVSHDGDSGSLGYPWQSLHSQDSNMSQEEAADVAPDTNEKKPLNLLDLPNEIIEKIIRYMAFETVAKIRLVCRRFGGIGSSILNTEFQRLRILMQQRFQTIKGQMPRRESARRKHPLARESDIVETLHMRLTLLQMTFSKHVERKHCCFFAGEILDEVYRILKYIKTTPNLSRAYKVTDELFDLSTMAMEYFKEHIEPTLPEITYFATDFMDYTPSFSSSPKTQLSLMDSPTSSNCSPGKSSPTSLEPMPSPSSVNPAVRQRLRKLRENMKRNNGQVLAVKRELKLTRRRVVSQQKQIQDLKARFEDYDKKFQNTSRKLSAVLQELSRCKTELQYWRSKSPAAHCSCGKVTPVTELKEGEPNPFGEEGGGTICQPDVLGSCDELTPMSDLAPLDCTHLLVVPACHGTPSHALSTIKPLSPSALSIPECKLCLLGEACLDKDVRPLASTRLCKRKLQLDDETDAAID